MRSRWFFLLLATAFAGVGTAVAKPAPERPVRPRAPNLFASAGLLMEVNRVQCGLVNIGEVCVAFAGSPVGGGGFWPKGTPDQYIFNSGLQLAGRVDPAANFAWAGDTIGAFIFDPRGTQVQGSGISLVFNALNPADAASWPNGAVVRDASIYNPVLLNRNTISQGDVWVRYWEGDPVFLSGRTHPMGIAVDQRALGWNFPSGNEDIIYFVFTYYNVTARSSSGRYNNPTIPPAIQAEIAALGDQFQDLNENKFKIQIPDNGYAISSLYAAFAMDADVAVFSTNYGTAILPFNIGTIYAGDFLPEVGWQFPPDIFGAPFAAAPGFVGVKYLKSPIDPATGREVGLTLFSNTINGPSFPDAVGVNQLFRYLSGNVGPSDQPCNPFTDPSVARARRLCFLSQQQQDARFYQASGPSVLPPGEARTIVVAYVHGAPLAEPLTPFIGGDLKPGVPATGDAIFQDRTLIRTIDRVAGWVDEAPDDGDGVIEENEVITAPRSLLDKAKVAQAVFNNGFLLPFSPDAPNFFLVPANNQVTVVWEKSRTEADGDPFFAVASDNTSPLYDPNFREFDVEGYRIYRGRTSSELTLVAQFDYTNTVFSDFNGSLAYGDTDGDGLLECAPELGTTADCPSFPNDVDLSGNVIQVPPGGRTLLASGSVLNLRTDTAVTGGPPQCLIGRGLAARCPELSNSGVTFAYIDTDVRNSFTYHYAVTAFDVNSVKSGPTSLESPRVTKRVIPRRTVANEVAASLTFGLFGDDNVELNPTPSTPFTIDAATGRFSGTPPPTGAVEALFVPLVPQLLPALNLTATIDSVLPRTGSACAGIANIQGICFEFFLTFVKDGTPTRFQKRVFWPIWTGFGEPASAEDVLGLQPVPADPTASARFAIPAGAAQFNASLGATLAQYLRFSAHEGQQSRRLRPSAAGSSIGFSPGGSRWFSGPNETVDHPAYGMRAGRLPGVDTIFAPLSHIDTDPVTAGGQAYSPDFSDAGGNTVRTVMQCYSYAVAALGRQADIVVTWGGGGQISSVRDITHRVNVPFRARPQAGYGFITDQNGNGKVDWRDFDRMDGIAQANTNLGFCAGTDPGAGNRGLLVAQPVIGPVSTAGASPDGTTAGFPTTGTGFGIYINGQQFIFQLCAGAGCAATAPPSGTTWTLRSYAGSVGASATTLGTTTPSGYTFTAVAASPAVPGLQVKFNVAARTDLGAEADDILANVHTVPDPYYVTNALEITANQKVLKFVNLPSQAIIRIYSTSGVLVNILEHSDPTFGAEATWNLRNRNNQFVASGVYFYHVETPSGKTKVGRFTLVNFAP